MYSALVIPLVGPFISIPGLILSFIHDSPGFLLATKMGLRNHYQTVSFQEGLVIEVINGFIWAVIYGLIGWVADEIRANRNARRTGLQDRS